MYIFTVYMLTSEFDLKVTSKNKKTQKRKIIEWQYVYFRFMMTIPVWNETRRKKKNIYKLVSPCL